MKAGSTKQYLALLVGVFLFGFVVSSLPVSAQGYCPAINSGNYPQCCPPRNIVDGTQAAGQAVQCQNYRQSLCASNPSDSICNPIRGGTQPTNPGSPTTPPFSTGSDLVTVDKGIISTTDAIDMRACSVIKFKSLVDVLIWIKCVIVSVLIPLIFVAAFLVFLWGVFRFMTASTAKDKKVGQGVIWWGMIALFAMVSIWGIIKIVGTVLGLETGFVPQLQ